MTCANWQSTPRARHTEKEKPIHYYVYGELKYVILKVLLSYTYSLMHNNQKLKQLINFFT